MPGVPCPFATHCGQSQVHWVWHPAQTVAEAAFREATRTFPTNGSAFNNLAQVVWEQGKQQEALKAARKAVELGGPLVNTYRKTLEQIQARKP